MRFQRGDTLLQIGALRLVSRDSALNAYHPSKGLSSMLPIGTYVRFVEGSQVYLEGFRHGVVVGTSTTLETLRDRRSHERGTSTSRVMTASMRAPCRQATCIAAQLDFPSVADHYSDRVQPGPGRFVFVPDSATDEVDGPVLVEAAIPPGVLRTVRFGAGATDEGLDFVAPVVVEGVLAAGHRSEEHTSELQSLRH